VTAATATQPALRLVRVNPLTVKGVHFKPRDRVRVVVLTLNTMHLTLTTTRTGTFTARFPDLTVDRCTTLEIQATGNHHETALLKTKPLCPPP
jgi:hypothetical protein